MQIGVFSVSDIIYSLSSKPESFGRTVLEPLRLGRPVIAWNKGGAGEILAAIWPQGLVNDQDTSTLLTKTRAQLIQPEHVPQTTAFLQDTMCRSTIALYQALAKPVD